MRRAFNSISALFPGTLIREDGVKRSKSLPAFKLFLSKNSIKAGKDFDRLALESLESLDFITFFQLKIST